MKFKLYPFFALAILLLTVTACGPSSAAANVDEEPVSTDPEPVTVPTATQTPLPTPTEVPSPWKLVQTAPYSHPVYYAGFLNDSFGITVGYAGEVHYTLDGGQTWPDAENHSMCRFGLDIVDEQVAWHCGNGGDVRLSLDGGQTWSEVAGYGPNVPNHCRYLSFLDEKTGWAATNKTLGMTTDGAQTWTNLTLPEDVKAIMTVSLRTPTDGYLLDNSGTLYVTSDGGQTWSSQKLDILNDAYLKVSNAPSMSIVFTDAQHGMLVFLKGNMDDGVYTWSAYTEDGGQTWQLEEVPFGRGIPNVYLAHDGRTLTAVGIKDIRVYQFQP
jgi:photosystem II stability/assembly factor-like uncharacterized protein